MKHISIFSIIFLLLLQTSQLYAQPQNIPNSSGPVGGSAGIPLPTRYNGGGNWAPIAFNYSRSWSPLVPTNSTSIPFSPLYYNMTTTYTNGWGQPLQSNVRGLNRDLITIYDNRTLLDKPTYLTYPSSTSGISFQMNPFADQKAWYAATYPTEGDNAYTRTKVVSNNGARFTENYSAGKSFTGNNKGTSSSEEVGGDDIIRMGTELYNGVSYPVKLGFFGASDLKLQKSVGPTGSWSVQYTTRGGNMVCQWFDGGRDQTSRPLYSYYVYDDLGRITWVIPPKAVEELNAAGWPSPSVAQDIYDGLCYHYKYNGRGQVVERRIPDRGLEETVYDTRHRPILTRTPHLAALSKWAFLVYDDKGRIAFSGLLESSQSRESYQSNFDNPLGYLTTFEKLIKLGCNKPYPQSAPNAEILQYNYYDDYTFDVNFPHTRNYDNSYSSLLSTAPTAINSAPFYFARGLLTASKVKVVNGSGINDWIYNVNFYNQKGLLIQNQSLNPFNTVNWDVITTQYNFDGSVNTSITDHKLIPGGPKSNTLMVVRNSTYGTPDGIKKETTLKLDTDPEMVLSAETFDDLGRVRQKDIGNAIQKQVYDYNIRGQLTGINADYLTNLAYRGSTFGCQLFYDYGFQNPTFDGSISGIIWRGAGSGANRRAYGYTYDHSGRLIGADYNEELGSMLRMWSKDMHDYSVDNLFYDANGNMETMHQRGVKNDVLDMDDLTFFYKPHSNQLERVEDNVPDHGLNDFVNRNSGSTDYSYSANGNLVSDLNKGIMNIDYSELDLPLYVHNPGKGDINNMYDAAGGLLQKDIHPAGGTSVSYRYWGPFVYRNNELEYILHSEGRVRPNADRTGYLYDYFIKDHLGNVRSVVQRDGGGIRELLATHEYASARTEQLIFDGLDRRVPRPGGAFDEDMIAAELDGTDPDKRTGTSLLLKVMAGDKFKAQVSAYYDAANFDPNPGLDGQSMAGSLFESLAGGMTDLGNSELGGVDFLNSMLTGEGFVEAYQNVKESMTDPSMPRAYLNYLLFDEEMHLVEDQSGAIQVNANNELNWAELEMANDIEVAKNGYMLVYISNEDQSLKVYFDNLLVTYARGILLEEQQYYPHGLLVQNGTNNPLANKYLYQGKEMQKEAGMELYDFHARQYDPQIGRFWGIDPLDQFPSGYTGMGNDPANLVDPSGMQVSGISAPENGYNFNGLQDRRNPFLDGTWSETGGLPAESFLAYMKVLNTPKFGGPSSTTSQGVVKTGIIKDSYGNRYGTYLNGLGEPNLHAGLSMSEVTVRIDSKETAAKKGDLKVEDADYHPFIPDAIGITIGGTLNGFTGFSGSVSMGFVGDEFGFWYTTGINVGTPEMSTGVSFFMSQYKGNSSDGPPTINSYMGHGSSNNVGFFALALSRSEGYRNYGDDNPLWITYSAGATLSSREILPFVGSYNYSPNFTQPIPYLKIKLR
jgi:RHS repeat-associated protein